MDYYAANICSFEWVYTSPRVETEKWVGAKIHYLMGFVLFLF
jgi:hypothetical protein